MILNESANEGVESKKANVRRVVQPRWLIKEVFMVLSFC